MNKELPPIKDSGSRREFSTGAVRDRGEAKGRWDLLPFHTIQRVSVHYERGCEKYGDRNWEKGLPVGEYLNSCLRHLMKWWLGHKDEDHLVAFVWNALCLMETAERVEMGVLPKELDNRPPSLIKLDGPER
jgi:hypothetical protein